MSDVLGAFCLVLHGHIPYVLRHGGAPHGESWLYEAVAETYLPLLDLLGDVAVNGARPAITIGLTPVLLEQLADPDFKAGFIQYLQHRIARAKEDRADLLRLGDAKLASLATYWERWYQARLDHFQQIAGDLVRQFAQRHADSEIQLLAGAATHAYLPLLTADQSIHAQLAAGNAVTSRLLPGAKLSGLWLPECAYRPAADLWKVPVLDTAGFYRPGIETFLPPVGISHTFVDSHIVAGGQPLGIVLDGRFFATSSAQAHRDRKGGWREALEPIGIASEPGRAEVFALARHPSLAQQVWSSKVGYPGDGAYLEFHKKHHAGGLRYWRVTDVTADLGAKEPYEPDATAGRCFANAQHFCSMIHSVLRDYHNRTGRPGVCVAAFDAELFGHWWFEGPRFLRDVILTLAADSTIKLLTAQETLSFSPPDKIMRLMEGSWGRGGDHAVWLNDTTKWMWQIEHRAEKEMLYQAQHLPWQTNPRIAEALTWAGRQLLLLQASDWPFIVENGSALDYAIKRFAGHSTQFDRAIAIAKHAAAGLPALPRHAAELADMTQHDAILPHIDLNWWTIP